MIRGLPSNSVSSHCPGAVPLEFGSIDGALQDVGLLRVVLRHLDAALGESLVHFGDEIVIALQLDAESGGDGFAREVVLGRAKAAHEDGEVGAADCGARDRGEVVADCRRQWS